MIRRSIFFILLLLVLGLFAYLYITRFADYPLAQATLEIQSGKATITHAEGNKQESVDAGAKAAISSGDVIQAGDNATLTFVGGQLDLWPGTDLEIKRYSAFGSEGKIDFVLKAGQIVEHLDGYTSARSLATVSSLATMSARGGQFLARMTKTGATQFASFYGTATISAKDRSLIMSDGQGLTLGPKDDLPDPAPWVSVRVPIYRADGDPVALSVALVDPKGGESYSFHSNELTIVPPGTYTLTVAALGSFQAQNLNLTSPELHELPVTLGEVVFTTIDANGKPVNFTGLTLINGDQKVRAVPDTPVLVSPGPQTVQVSREDNPNAVQPLNLTVDPGQHMVVTLRNDLFGGGNIKVDITAPEGASIDPVQVSVYPKGSEGNAPVQTFKSDGPSPLLAPGDYVISVGTRIGVRYPIMVKLNQTSSVTVPLGTLNISYLDPQGKPVTRTVMVYVASAVEMDRLALPITQMRTTPYGILVPLKEASQLMLPAGAYNVYINDVKPMKEDNVQVPAGQASLLELRMPAQ